MAMATGRSGPPAQQTSSSRPSVRPSAVRTGQELAVRDAQPRRPSAARQPPLRVGPVTARASAVAKPLGQICPICHSEPATVEMRIGAVYAKLGARCVGSGVHLVKVLSKLFGA